MITLEHGNFTAKDGELRRVWKGNSKEGNKQLFRLMRLQSSPTLRKVIKKLELGKRKQMKCSRCNDLGHKRNSKKYLLFETTAEADGRSTEGGDVMMMMKKMKRFMKMRCLIKW